MSRLTKSALIKGIAGFFIGLLIGITIFCFSNIDNLDNVIVTGDVLFKILAGGIYGAISMGGSVVYEIDSMSIAAVTFSHFAITFSGFIMLSFVQEWLDFSSMFFRMLIALWIVVYVFIWLANYLSYKSKVKKLNEDLKAIRREEKD
ncbi:MAG: DUF3021 domain-containing protein [Butyrivibrio sp.]|nr:DUF3021 domain-containing protein [Butyrivibrio sp.]